MSRIYIDDQDLSKVSYTGTWVKGGTPHEYAGTVASSIKVGDYFVVSFKGNSIAVYGTFDATSAGVVTSYSIDGAPPAQATAQSGAGDTYSQQFWRSNILSVGEHKLNVTMVKVNYDPEPGEGTIWFDYFIVTDPTIASTSNLTPDSTNPPVVNRSSGGPPVGAIVGGVIGGVFFVLAIVLAVLLLFSRRKSRRENQHTKWNAEMASRPSGPFHHGQHPPIEPYLLTGRDMSANYPPSTTVDFDPNLLVATPPVRKPAMTASGEPSSVFVPPGLSDSSGPRNPTVVTEPQSSASLDESARHTGRTSNHNRKPSGLPSPPSSDGSAVSSPHQHVDSGFRASDMQRSVVPMLSAEMELPPVYSPV